MTDRFYSPAGYRETPFAVERQLPDGRTVQAYDRDGDKSGLYALLEKLADVPAVEVGNG